MLRIWFVHVLGLDIHEFHTNLIWIAIRNLELIFHLIQVATADILHTWGVNVWGVGWAFSVWIREKRDEAICTHALMCVPDTMLLYVYSVLHSWLPLAQPVKSVKFEQYQETSNSLKFECTIV